MAPKRSKTRSSPTGKFLFTKWEVVCIPHSHFRRRGLSSLN